MRSNRFIRLTAGLVLVCAAARAQLPAFPGAEGAGAYAVGGRYGDVYHVTTLSSSATTPGSIYYGLNTAPSAGRTIVFDVSGYIHIGGTYTLNNPKITIAGQTAPGDGIGFKDGTFNISASDIIVRHVRFRDGNSADAADLDSDVNRCIMDHCDVMLSNDENLSSFGSPPDNFTFQWCMNAWGMESHSCGGLWDQQHATCHHSLWSHNHTRNPKSRPTLLEWINNVTFDWDIGFIMGDSTSTADWKANVRGSYFVCPPGNLHGAALEKANLQDANGLPNFSLYLDDCAMDANGDGVLNVSKSGYALASGSYATNATPFAATGVPVTRDGYLTAYKKVLSIAGPLRLDSSQTLRDELSAILVNNLVAQRRNHVSSPTGTGASNGGFGTLASTPAPADTDRDGMPDFWETTLGSNANLDDHTNAVSAAAFVPAGYTLLEEYLQFLAMPHGNVAKFTASVPSSLDVDLHKYTGGFTNKLPVTYTISNVTNGAVTLSNGYLAHFVPPTNYFGRARFDFTVTDGDSSTWTQTFAVLVSSLALPRDLLWKGDGVSNNFDTNALTFLFGASLTAFSPGDNVTFDDTGSTNPAVNIVGALTPGSLTLNAAKNYTLGGSGTLGGTMALSQSGGGTLTVKTANSFSGGGVIDGSAVIINSGGDLGSGPLTLQNATLTSTYGSTSAYTLDNLLTLPDSTASTLNLSPRMSFGGLSGNGVLNVKVSGTPFNYDNLNGSFAAFTGTLNITGAVAGALLTENFNGGGFDGNLANAAVNLDNVALIGRHNSGGNALTIGALSGTATSRIQGSGYAGPMTLAVGGLNLDTVYAGTITTNTLNPATTNRIVKLGTGRWTLSGTNTFAGVLVVSNGTLRVTGSDDGNLVTVAEGATLDGTGVLKGGVTLQTGGIISPGLGFGNAGTLTTSNTLTLTAPTLLFDLSGSPTGANDAIAMQGGRLAMSGLQNYVFSLTDNALGAGTYKLIEGATDSTAWSGVTHNLPSGTRQSFNVYRAAAGSNPSYVRLSVTGNAASLAWAGTRGSAWDVNTTTNWLNGAAASTFFNLDSVRFDDSSTNGIVSISGTVQPALITVTNNTRAYTLGGGEITGLGELVKSGTASLTLTGTNTFSGGTTLLGGTLYLANDTASQFGLGSGTITLLGGTLSMYSDVYTYNSAYWNLAVPAGATGRLNTDARCNLYGTLTGGGTLDYYVTYVRTELDGDWSGFTGRINVLADSDGGDFRINNDAGYANAAIALATNVAAYHMVAGTVAVGELSGAVGSTLSTANWIVGGRNTDATFAGTILGATTLTKIGSGALTLNRANTYSGSTTVNGGTLRVSNATGSATGEGDVTVNSGATLSGSGSISGIVTINDGGVLAPGNGSGTLTLADNLDLNAGSSVIVEVSTNHVSGNDQIVVGGNLRMSGNVTVHINALSDAANLDRLGDYVLFAVAGTTTLPLAPTLVWDGAPPSNYLKFTLAQVGNNVVLRYVADAAPSVTAVATPSAVTRNQSFTIAATVTPGSGAVSRVTVDLSPLGGSAVANLAFSGGDSYTNTFKVSAGTSLGSKPLTVTVTDNTAPAPFTGTCVISPFTVTAANSIWDGGSAIDNNWTSNPNWSNDAGPGLEGDSVTFAGTTRLTPSMDTGYNLTGITFSNTADSFTIGATNNSTLTLTGTGVINNSASSQTLNVPITMGATQTLNAAAGDLTLGQTVANGGNLLTVSGISNTVVSGAISGAGGLTKTGNGTLRLSGANTYAGATVVSGGTLNVPSGGALNFGGTANVGLLTVGTSANTNALLKITGGTVNALFGSTGNAWAGYLTVGSVSNANGAIQMTSGALTASRHLVLANAAGAYGAMTLSGGSLSVGSYLVTGFGGGYGVFNQSGGAVTQGVATVSPMLIGSGAGSVGVVTLSGGTLAATAAGVCLPENGASTGTLNIMGSAAVSVDNMGLKFGTDNAASAGTLNLLGGTLTANAVLRGNGTANFNFNGGTLKASGATNWFMGGLSAATVYSGGAVIDDGGFAITVAQPLLAPMGNGVGGITSFTPGAGYMDQPVVTISGGGGSGATALATVSGGAVTGITLTSPGVGYTSAPSFTLSGGGATSAASITGAALSANVSGGLTKLGTGTLTLSGTNSYTGATLISNGVLRLGVANAISKASALRVAGGTLDLNGYSVTNDSVLLYSGSLTNGGLSSSSITKLGTGTLSVSAALSSGNPLIFTSGFAKFLGPQPGLYEGSVTGSFNTVTANPRTATPLTTRCANVTTGWVDNTTVAYSGTLWNRAATNVTWTFAESFDDSVLLKIDGVTVLSNTQWYTPTLANCVLTPGAHALELRVGQSSAGAGPCVVSWWTSSTLGVGYDPQGRGQQVTANYRALTDPGDGSLLTQSSAAGMIVPASSVVMATGTTLDLGGTAQTWTGLSGCGCVTNGTLTVTGALAPGGTNTIGTLTLAASTSLAGTLLLDVAADGSSDLLNVQGTLVLAGAALQVQDVSRLTAHGPYVIARFKPGALTGVFSSTNLGASRWSVSYDSKSGVVRLIRIGLVLTVQ